MRRFGLKPQVWIPIAVSWSSLFALGLIDNARGPILPDLSQQFALDATQRSTFFMTSSASAFIHNLIVFRFLERASPIRLIALYSFVLSVGGLGLSVAPTFQWVLGAAVLMGLGFGGLAVGQNAALRNLDRGVRLRAVSGLHGMYGVASMIAPAVAVLFFPDWRLAILILTLPGLAVGLYAWQKSRSEADWEHPGRAQITEPSGAADVRALESDSALAVAAAVAVGGAVVLEIAMSSRLVSVLRENWKVDPHQAGLSLSAFFTALTLARIGLALRPHKGQSGPMILGALFISGAGALAILSLGETLPNSGLVGSVFGLGLTIGTLYPLMIEVISQVAKASSQRILTVATTSQVGFLMAMHFGIGRLEKMLNLPIAVGIMVSLGAIAAFAGTVVIAGHERRSERNLS